MVQQADILEVTAIPPLPSDNAAPERESRMTRLLRRAGRRAVSGPMLTALSSGLLSSDPHQTDVIFETVFALQGESVTARRAMSTLLTMGREGEVGALVVLAWLGDERSRERIAEVIGNPRRSVAARVAAIRGSLFVMRQHEVASGGSAAALRRSLEDATADDRPAIRYAAAFVRAAMGDRAVRGELERGALEESDAELLRLCLLGLESIGDAASLPFVWRVWMRHPGLRGLADSVAERLEEDFRRRQLDILGEPGEVPDAALHEVESARMEDALLPEVVVSTHVTLGA